MSSDSLISMTEDDIIYDWNSVKRRGALFPKPIELCDETLRDGIQSPSVVDPPIETKFEMVELMDALGVTVADIGLPGAGARAVEDVTAIAKFMRDNKLNMIPTCAARTSASLPASWLCQRRISRWLDQPAAIPAREVLRLSPVTSRLLS